jgi:hypothetical protein
MSFTWSHSTNSRAKLALALADPLVEAIEADILMGRDTTTTTSTASSSDAVIDNVTQLQSSSTINIEPIMGHPPHQESDLSVTTFLNMVTITNKTTTSLKDTASSALNKQQQEQHPHAALQKHIKLDFKEIETVQPTLTQLQNLLHPADDCNNTTTTTGTTTTATSTLKKTVFLNADILPGPGKRNVEHMPSSAFLDSCLAHIARTQVNIGCSASAFGFHTRHLTGIPFYFIFISHSFASFNY